MDQIQKTLLEEVADLHEVPAAKEEVMPQIVGTSSAVDTCQTYRGE